MFAQPKDSPWGMVDYCDILRPGVFLIYTPDHGGTMVSREIEEFLSPAARRYGQRKNGYLCFEQDADEEIVFREMLDKKLWEIPARVRNKAAFEENINAAQRRNHPQYWRSRENGRVHKPPVIPAPAHAR
jgi:hypothetical protein